LCATADVGELVAFYRGLPLYPDQRRHVLRAAEGVRTNMKACVPGCGAPQSLSIRTTGGTGLEPDGAEGVIHRRQPGSNRRPGPPRQSGAGAHALRLRARTLAAGRPVSPELWRCVGPHARGDMLADLGRVLEKGTGPERAAAALALSSSPDPAASGLLWAYPELSVAVSDHKISWQAICESSLTAPNHLEKAHEIHRPPHSHECAHHRRFERMAAAGIVAIVDGILWTARTQVGSYIDYMSSLVGWDVSALHNRRWCAHSWNVGVDESHVLSPDGSAPSGWIRNRLPADLVIGHGNRQFRVRP